MLCDVLITEKLITQMFLNYIYIYMNPLKQTNVHLSGTIWGKF